MCHFITLIAPTAEAEHVRAIMCRHGRAAQPMDNPSLRKVLQAGEHQYLTTAGHCDCGTVLADRHETREPSEDLVAKDVALMKRKGWSEAKIARAMKDRRKAEARPGREGPDSLELWSAVLHDLGEELKLPYAGLFVRQYSGAISTEAFSASRRQVPRNASRLDALGSIEPEEVTIFPLR